MSHRSSRHQPCTPSWMAVLVLGAFCLLLQLPASSHAAGDGVTVKLRNDSGEILAVHWVHPTTQEATLMTNNVQPNQTYTLQSFLSHKFQIRQIPDADSGLCNSGSGGSGSGGGGGAAEEETGEQTCRVNYFQVTERPEQNVLVKRGIEIENVAIHNEALDEEAKLMASIDDVAEEPSEVIEKCKAEALGRTDDDDGPGGPDSVGDLVFKTYQECLLRGVAPNLMMATAEVDFERDLRYTLANAMENFTCVDAGLETSPDLRHEEWTSPKDNVMRSVHVMLDRPTSRIHFVENFASPMECKAMEEEAQAKLSVASTADGKGGTKISIARKAMQAAITPEFSDREDGTEDNLIAVLSSRVYEYTNHVLDLNISHHGQEPLMSIQYFGRGYNDSEPDRYTPHCDGKCEGAMHIPGGRIATMVIYCTIPNKGGFTNFQNANVHIKPSEGSAIFFSYMDPLTNMTDHRLTQHSGCPVYEGEKKIVTQWVRYGVDAQTTHNHFNTLNILKSEDGD